MKFATSALLGLLGGLGLVSLTSFALLRSPAYKTRGLPTEHLAHGAGEWKVIASPPAEPASLVALPGNELAALRYGDQAEVLSPSTLTWTTKAVTVEAPLAFPSGGPTHIFWSPLSPTEALAAYYDDVATGAKSDKCQLYLEPKHERLPVLPPPCERASGATRLTRGAILALAWSAGDQQTRGMLLEPGAQAWKDAGVLPEDGNGELVSGAGDRALYAGFGKRVVLFEDGAWKALPKNVEPRYAYKFALADDGAVLITGGQQDEAAGKTVLVGLLPLLALGGLLSLAIVARVKWKASVGGMVAGFAVSLLLAAIAFVAMLPLFAWH